MRKKLSKISTIVLVILLFAAKLTLAGESFSIPVSCSIPSVPGINAPPFPEEKIVQVQITQDLQATNSKSALDEQAIKMKREKPKPEMLLVEEKRSNATIQTIYSR